MIVSGHTIWFSEPVAIIGTGLMLVFLLSISAAVFINTLSLSSLDKSIAAIRSENIDTEHLLSGLRTQSGIVMLLRSFAGGKVPDHTLCQVADIVCRNSAQFGYDPLLLLAVIRVESVFDPAAAGQFRSGSASGAIGLMQVKFETAAEVAKKLEMPPISESDLLKPEINLVIGVAYLTRLISRFKSFKLGLLAYNQGPGAVFETLSSKEPLSISYYLKVLRNYYALINMEKQIEKDTTFP